MLPVNETIELRTRILSRPPINAVHKRAEIVYYNVNHLNRLCFFDFNYLPNPTYAVKIHVVKLIPSAFLVRIILNTCVNRLNILRRGHSIC